MSIKFTSHDMAWRAFTRLKHHFGDEELFLVSWQQSQRYLKSVRRARQNSNEHIQQATRSFFAPKTIQVSSPKKTLIASADSKEVEVCSPSDSTTKPTNKPKKKDPKSSSVKKKVSKKKSDVNSEVKSSTETVQESPLMIHE